MEHGLGAFDGPPGAGLVHTVAHEVAAGSLDDSRRDWKAIGQCVGIPQVVAVVAEWQVAFRTADGGWRLTELIEFPATDH